MKIYQLLDVFNWKRIYGGVYTFTFSFIYSLRYEKDFCQCYQNYLRHLWLKFFIVQMSGGWFPWQPKGVYIPHKSRGVSSDILATTSRLNTLYGLETWYVQSCRHVEIIQKVLRHFRHFLRIYDVINVGFFRHFAVFGYSKCHKVCKLLIFT